MNNLNCTEIKDQLSRYANFGNAIGNYSAFKHFVEAIYWFYISGFITDAQYHEIYEHYVKLRNEHCIE